MASRRLSKKQEKLADKPESILSVAIAGIQFILVVVGIIGLSTAIFGGEEGLLATGLQKLIDADITSVMITAAIVFVVFYFGSRWFTRTFDKDASKVLGTLALYLMMAFGAYHLVNYLLLN